jgi:hypothetical protein
MFNDTILNKYIIMYKCALVGVFYLVYRFEFAESNVARKWDRVIFTDKSTFSSANEGLILVYRPHGELYYPQYKSTCNAVIVCLSTFGAGTPMKGLEF